METLEDFDMRKQNDCIQKIEAEVKELWGEIDRLAREGAEAKKRDLARHWVLAPWRRCYATN